MTHYLFALVLVFLKLGLKVGTGRSMTRVDMARAILNFPLDLAFLGLSFGIVYIMSMQTKHLSRATTEEVLLIFSLYIIFGISVAIICRKSDMLFNKDESGWPLLWTGVNYILTIFALLFSIYIQ
ncbi:hypothetical protein GIY62_22785 [Burkholderia plantarii]|uniref:hypothetical protein n=1 Tax=Burkholderia plantarii TaxID=41899 RepID=UPI00272BFBF8|nr:hypothetical protein [Burkholderia plantarii]WLE63160.1 hypothetical protein GIY62_22785 [Burkholderia plantarii]